MNEAKHCAWGEKFILERKGDRLNELIVHHRNMS